MMILFLRSGNVSGRSSINGRRISISKIVFTFCVILTILSNPHPTSTPFCGKATKLPFFSAKYSIKTRVATSRSSTYTSFAAPHGPSGPAGPQTLSSLGPFFILSGVKNLDHALYDSVSKGILSSPAKTDAEMRSLETPKTCVRSS